MAVSLSDLVWDNSFTRELPADPSREVRPRSVTGAAFSWVDPTPTAAPTLLAVSRDMLDELGLDPAATDDPQFPRLLSGNQLAPEMEPFAMCYGGHQFGNWAGQLGDGRAIGLGEVVNRSGDRFALQLKGAGPTPYSRSADGLAVMRSSIREFLCSEAMFHLTVPTTRALSLVSTGDQVMRDMFYDGNAALEPGAVVCRVAPSFVRFGNFQLPASRDDKDLLRAIADHTVNRFFPHLGPPSPAAYGAMFSEVVASTALMVAHWMRVGFVHGVMNTDNMSILGLTIDYGPYGWLENYDPDWTPNTTDAGQRRYRYGQQAQVAHWNLVQLANALYPLIEDAAPLQTAIDSYSTVYDEHNRIMSAAKLGLADLHGSPNVGTLIDDLQAILASIETDMTIFYRRLADVDVHTNGPIDAGPLDDAYYRPDQRDEAYKSTLSDWLDRYAAAVRTSEIDPSTRHARMNAANPKYVLRNYLAQLAIDKAHDGDYSGVEELLDRLGGEEIFVPAKTGQHLSQRGLDPASGRRVSGEKESGILREGGHSAAQRAPPDAREEVLSAQALGQGVSHEQRVDGRACEARIGELHQALDGLLDVPRADVFVPRDPQRALVAQRSEEHTSELQSH